MRTTYTFAYTFRAFKAFPYNLSSYFLQAIVELQFENEELRLKNKQLGGYAVQLAHLINPNVSSSYCGDKMVWYGGYIFRSCNDAMAATQQADVH